MTQEALNELGTNLLAKRHLLPEKPDPFNLEGQYVILKPLDIERDAIPLFEISNGSQINLDDRVLKSYDADKLIWRYMVEGPFQNIQKFKEFLLSQVNAPNGLCLCIFDKLSGRQVGVINLMNNFPAHLKVELGCIWYSPIVQRTFANTEATYLIMKHVFELGYRRIEWKCHSHNERSRRAALRIGFKFEGIHESHLIVKGCNRDTAWFRLLENEWTEVKGKLEQILYQNKV
jgi:RimJ/RimL family protein N-acetyltransferase